MNEKQIQTLVSGVIATVAISLYYYLIDSLGVEVLTPWRMIEYLLNVSLFWGWVFHLSVGLIFTWIYRRILSLALRKIKNLIFRGLTYGFIVFVISDVVIGLIDFDLGMTIGYHIVSMGVLFLGDLIFGTLIGLMVPPRNFHIHNN